LTPGRKKPVERHLIDRHHRFAVDRLRLKMNRRIHMGAVMRRERDLFDCPALAIRQILAAQTGKQIEQKGRGLGVAAVGDFRPHKRRVIDRFVFKRRRQIDNSAGQFHDVPLNFALRLKVLPLEGGGDRRPAAAVLVNDADAKHRLGLQAAGWGSIARSPARQVDPSLARSARLPSPFRGGKFFRACSRIEL
jgi:hypothetical protein